jgi:hypothetical protein
MDGFVVFLPLLTSENYSGISVFLLLAAACVAAEPSVRPDGVYRRKNGEAETVSVSGIAGDALTVEFQIDSAGLATPGRLLALRDASGGPVVSLEVRRAGSDPSMRWWDDSLQNYMRWAGLDGSVSVLEATADVAVAPPYVAKMKKQVRIGVPVPLVGETPGRVLLRLRPGKVELVVDDLVVDEEWPCGGPQRPVVDLVPGGRVTGARVWHTWLDDETAGVRPATGVETGKLDAADFQYWSPPGHNRWAGDTMLYHDGERLHLMYLIDRRHGASKSVGGHQIAHLSSTDMKTWTVHPLAVPITEPWETMGTGNMIKRDGRWYILYGLHTDRVIEGAATIRLTENEPSRTFDPKKDFPRGTAIASSDDGIHFKKDNVLVSASENPSVVHDPRGGYAMFAGYGADGLYHSDDLRTWKAEDNFITPFGAAASMRNSTECYSSFAWNGWHYLLGGRTGFWMSRNFAGPYWDQAAATETVTGLKSYFQWRLKGAAPVRPAVAGEVFTPAWDIYDGLWVPMAARAVSERRVLAGWLEDLDRWAGCLVLRELNQESDGNLSLAWWPEGVPTTGEALALKWTRTQDGTVSRITTDGLPNEFLLETEIEAGAGTYAIVVGGGEGAEACELRIEPARGRAQWGRTKLGTPAADTPGLAEIFATEDGRKPIFNQKSKNLPFKGGDFAITGITGLEKKHRLRLLFIHDWKSGSVIIDAEIDGRRTMITRRRGLTAKHIQLVGLSGDVRFSGTTVRPVQR